MTTARTPASPFAPLRLPLTCAGERGKLRTSSHLTLFSCFERAAQKKPQHAIAFQKYPLFPLIYVPAIHLPLSSISLISSRIQAQAAKEDKAMSARSGKRFARNQERFVPKSQNPPPRADQTHDFRPRSSPADAASKANGPDDAAAASSSSSSSAAATAATAAASARVRMGKNGDWVSNRSHGGGFVKYLPQDEAVAAGLGAEDGALDPVESQRVVDLLNRELSRLLKMNPRDFWREGERLRSRCFGSVFLAVEKDSWSLLNAVLQTPFRSKVLIVIVSEAVALVSSVFK
ncbi:hypothetical protein ACLOJK_003591 [Asimina triloba]